MSRLSCLSLPVSLCSASSCPPVRCTLASWSDYSQQPSRLLPLSTAAGGRSARLAAVVVALRGRLTVPRCSVSRLLVWLASLVAWLLSNETALSRWLAPAAPHSAGGALIRTVPMYSEIIAL